MRAEVEKYCEYLLSKELKHVAELDKVKDFIEHRVVQDVIGSDWATFLHQFPNLDILHRNYDEESRTNRVSMIIESIHSDSSLVTIDHFISALKKTDRMRNLFNSKS